MEGTTTSAPPRGRIVRARTVPAAINPPPSFGVDFSKRVKPAPAKTGSTASNVPPQPQPTPPNSTVETVTPQPPVTSSQAAFSSTESFMQRYGETFSRPVGIQRQSAIRISPISYQEVHATKPGSVVIPSRIAIRDDAVGGVGSRDAFPRPQGSLDSSSLATAFVSPRIGRANSARQSNRVHFATPVGMTTTTPVASAVPSNHQSQTSLYGDNQPMFQTQLGPLSQQQQQQQHGMPVQGSNPMLQSSSSSGQISVPASQQFPGFMTQSIPAFPASYPTASPALSFAAPMASGQPQQQQQQAFLPNQMGTPAAPAFAVIAPDSAALQALLSGNVSGRAFIIQPLNMSPYPAPTQLVGGAPTFVAQPSTPPAGIPGSLQPYGASSHFAFPADAQRPPMMVAQNWATPLDPGVYAQPPQSQMFASQPSLNFSQPTSVGTGASLLNQPSEVSGLSASVTHLPSLSLQHPETVTHVQNLALPQATISLPDSLRNLPNPGMTAADASVQQQALKPSPPPPPPQIHTGDLVTPQPHRAALIAVQQPQSSAPTSQSQDVGDNKITPVRRTPDLLLKFSDSFKSPREDSFKTSLRQPQKLQVPPFLQSQELDPAPMLGKPLVSKPPAPTAEEPTPLFTAAVTGGPRPQPPLALATTSCAQHQQTSMKQAASAAEAPTTTTPSRRWLAEQRKELLKKTRSLPESEHRKILASASQDTNVPSVADRARAWLRQRQSVRAPESKFVDRDLVACEDLVPVEDRVRAFDSGKVAEANAAERRRLQEDYEEALSRRLQQQFGMEAASMPGPSQATTPAELPQRLQTRLEIKNASTRPVPGAAGVNLAESTRGRGTSRLHSMVPSKKLTIPERTQPSTQSPIQFPSPKVVSNDPLARMSVREKSNIFNRRTTGGRTPKLERQRRKTQPITFDDIAQANQRILDSAGGLGLETPLECFIDEEFDLGSVVSSPAASVLSDVSEYGLPISPKGRARIF